MRVGYTRVGARTWTRVDCHACTLGGVPLYLSPTENLFRLGYDFISFKTSGTRRHSRKYFKSLIPSSSRSTSLCGNRTVRHGFVFSTFDQSGRRRRCRRHRPGWRARKRPLPVEAGGWGYRPSTCTSWCVLLFFTCPSCMHVPVWVRGICLGTVETIPVLGIQFSRAPLLELVETIPLRWVSVLQASNIAAC